MLEQMALGICASMELKEILIELGVPEDKLVVNRLGIDLGAARPGGARKDPPQVVMVGRLVPQKGFEYGLRAFARAVTKRP